MGTGKAWSQEETLLACRAYIIASEDPRAGSGQKKEKFTSNILEQYKKLLANLMKETLVCYPDRSGEAIFQRFKKSRCECIKLEGIINSIKAKKPTGGPSEDDIERAAVAVYNGEGTIGQMYTFIRDRTSDVGEPFPYKQALSYLRTTHTWNIIMDADKKKKETSRNDSSVTENTPQTNHNDNINSETASVDNNHSSSSTAQKRPVGTKRALEQSKQYSALHKGADAIEAIAETSRKKVKIAEEMMSIDKQKSMIALFSMPGTNPQMKTKFMELSQLKALKELEKECNQGTTNQEQSQSQRILSQSSLLPPPPPPSQTHQTSPPAPCSPPAPPSPPTPLSLPQSPSLGITTQSPTTLNAAALKDILN